jgi:hypothetical protein
MLPLISVVLVILGALGIKRLLPRNGTRRRQVRFILETLAANRTLDNRRVIASLSTVPDRINNLTPTIRSLLRQTRPPDEIVLAIPEFSVRERRHYVVPKYISRLPRVRILRTREDWGPATKFIAAIQDELAAGRQNTLIMVVDDDRRLSTTCAGNLSPLQRAITRCRALFSRRRHAVHIGLGRCQNDSRERSARAARGGRYHWMPKLFGSAEIFRRIALGLFSSPASCVSYRRHLD